MSLPDSSAPDHDITRLKIKTDQERRATFLRYLAVSLIVLLALGLAVMLVRGNAKGYNFVFVASSLALNIVVFYLNRRRYVQPATHLFCHNFNLLTFFTFLINLTIEDSPAGAVFSANLMALTILLGGMLIGPWAIAGFAALNTALIVIPYVVFDSTMAALETGFPIIFFSYLIAVVSWLYQRTLNRSQARLTAANQELMQTRLMQRDLKIARDLQRRLYPTSPVIGQCLIASRCEPARETSGDFYDFIQLSPHELGIIVADVTGKSLPAALVMAMARSILRSEARRHTSPAMVLHRANQVLYDDASVDQMVTACYSILHTDTLIFHFANAGQLYPTLKRNGYVEDLELNGLPLRVRLEPNYQEKTVRLQPGDQLILVTDGIVEAMNANREMFGFDRLAETIQQLKTTDPQQTLQEIWDAVGTFRGEVEQHDDMTIVVIRVEDEAEVAET